MNGQKCVVKIVNSRRARINALSALTILACLLSSFGQDYKVNAAPAASQQTGTQKKKSAQTENSTAPIAPAAKPAPPQNSLGWGSNIQNARLASSAEQAIAAGNYVEALDYAQRAARAAPGDPQIWFLLGYAARLARRSQASIDAYKHGLSLHPGSLDGQSGLAQAYSVAGRSDEAIRILTNVVASDPNRSNDEIMLGELLLRTGDTDQALQVLQHAEQRQPAARAELLLALVFERSKQFDRAEHYLKLAEARAPNNPEVLRSLAGYYRETGNYQAAITALKSIKSSAPDVKAELAYTYQLAGQPEEAATLYAEAANASPSDLNLQLSAAQAQVANGTLELADPFLKRAANIDANNYRLHAVLGEIARQQERDDDAIKEYKIAIARMPTDPAEGELYSPQLHMNLAELYKSANDSANSDAELNIAQSQMSQLDIKGPKRPEFLRLRALIKIGGGDLTGASADIKEALDINSRDPNNLQLSGDLLVKSGHLDDAMKVYGQILKADPNNRLALTSMGFVSRELGHDQEAEKYFRQLATAYPKLYAPRLALGDMYASRHDFAHAEASYREAHKLAPNNSKIIAGGMNAAIEAKNLPLAADWLKLATPRILEDPFVLREKERYLSFTGKYEESAATGREAIKRLPKDRDVVVYLGYDLLHLERYDELRKLTADYYQILSKDPDIPLLAGYVNKHDGNLAQAELDFSESIKRDPKVTTAYVNRGYIRKDLHKPSEAVADFKTALNLEPDNGEAHLGLAYASLDLHQPKVALRQAALAEKRMGDSQPLHLIRATAYGDEGLLTKAAAEYRIALGFTPDDPNLHMALADTLYNMRQYPESIAELEIARKFAAGSSLVYAKLARAYAQLHDRDETLKNVELAEKAAAVEEQTTKGQTRLVYLSTGEALSLLGDRHAAMDRFAKALEASDRDSFGVRVEIARLMSSQGQWDDARRQIALGLIEAQTNEADPPLGSEWLEAADIFLGMNDFQLAQTYYQRALTAGAPPAAVHVGLANTYLVEGDTVKARDQLASVGDLTDNSANYQYLLAQANLYRQEHHSTQALTAFAQAASAAGEDETAERELLRAAGDEGLRLNDRVSVLSEFSVEPIFEDTTVYPLDAKLDVTNPVQGKQDLLPLPRSSTQTEWTGAYHLHFAGLPGAGGFFQVRNARGEISLPSADTIVDRNTTDYSFNFGLNPSVHLGQNVITFSAGVQETIRRDSSDPFDLNQNLFRQFVYVATSSFFNAISVSGYGIRESGPFTESGQHGTDLAGALNFRVGRPWGKTALLTGWGARDEKFNPIIREFYYTSVYGGLEHIFSQKLRVRGIVEDLRAWRVIDTSSAISQALRPGGSVQYLPTRNWSFEGNVAYSRNMGFHTYDAVQSGITVSYQMSVRQNYRHEGQDIALRYPVRFSGGLQQENFFNFPGLNSNQLRPFVSITLF